MDKLILPKVDKIMGVKFMKIINDNPNITCDIIQYNPDKNWYG